MQRIDEISQQVVEDHGIMMDMAFKMEKNQTTK